MQEGELNYTTEFPNTMAFRQTKKSYPFFIFVTCLFRTWIIMGLQNLLSLVTPSNICPLHIPVSSLIHLHIRYFTCCFSHLFFYLGYILCVSISPNQLSTLWAPEIKKPILLHFCSCFPKNCLVVHIFRLEYSHYSSGEEYTIP